MGVEAARAAYGGIAALPGLRNRPAHVQLRFREHVRAYPVIRDPVLDADPSGRVRIVPERQQLARADGGQDSLPEQGRSLVRADGQDDARLAQAPELSRLRRHVAGGLWYGGFPD